MGIILDRLTLFGFGDVIAKTKQQNHLSRNGPDDKLSDVVRRKALIKKVVIALLLLLILAGVGFTIWASNAAKPMPEALFALKSDSAVLVTSASWTEFQPVGKKPDTGLIFYPGGRVDYRAYAPYLHALAKEGYLVVLVPMPLNLAVFGSDKAGDVIKAFPEVKNWVLA
ncbi:MAG: hypothetical protein IH586_13045, partial [Anaerolineaceae bacterium]|nr:hypothetical protein [Anaerolineaceae bacterium]